MEKEEREKEGVVEKQCTKYGGAPHFRPFCPAVESIGLITEYRRPAGGAVAPTPFKHFDDNDDNKDHDDNDAPHLLNSWMTTMILMTTMTTSPPHLLNTLPPSPTCREAHNNNIIIGGRKYEKTAISIEVYKQQRKHVLSP